MTSKKIASTYSKLIKTASIIFIGTLFFLSHSNKTNAQSAVTPVGSGTETDPYLIADIDNLYWITQNSAEWEKHYLQTSDIDASDTIFWPGHGYVPIGNTNVKFTGIYDGGGYSISGIYMDGGGFRGLFGYTYGAIIRNLGVINVNITASANNAGGLVGFADDKTFIKNCFSTGEIDTNLSIRNLGGLVGKLERGSEVDGSYSEVNIDGYRHTGGLVGSSSWGNGTAPKVKNSYATGNVSGNNQLGGLLGSNFTSEVQNSYAIGNVSGLDNLGGLIGDNADGDVLNSYATGDVNGRNNVGGLIGINSGGSTIANTYSIGKVSGNIGVGGLTGNSSNSIVTNSYWNTATSNQNNSAGGNSLSTAQMKIQSNFSGFDFTNDWQIYEGYSFPFLKDVGNHITSVVKITGSENWRTMSSPFTNNSYDVLLKELWTQGFTGADYSGGDPNILIRSESVGSWNPPTNAFEIPGAGTGFLMYIYKNDQSEETGSFPKTLVNTGKQLFGFVSLPVSLTKSGSGGSYVQEDDGWNLIGNPYASAIDWDISGWTKNGLSNSIYIWSEQDDAYRTWNGSTGSLGSGVIAPWQGFWVKADNSGSPSLEINENSRSTGGQFLKEKKHPILEFTLEGEEKSSNAYVMINPEASIEMDRMDAWKLESLSSDYLSFYSLLPNGKALEINTVPITNENSVTIDFDLDGSSMEGSYKLLWNSDNLPADVVFTLADNVTNEKINLQEKHFYRFEISSKEKKREKKKEKAGPVHQVIKPEIKKTKNYAGNEFPRFTLSISNITSGDQDEVPTSVFLRQNYPNPFNPTTVIRYELPESSDVRLAVYDMAGREVATLVSETVQAGAHEVSFNASTLSSGVYMYRLDAGSQTFTRKLTLIK